MQQTIGEQVRSPAQSTVRRSHLNEYLLFIALVGPNLLLFCIFTYWPLIYNGYLSFVRWDMISPVKRWVGWNNYVQVFTSREFQQVLLNTFFFTFFSVAIICVVGLLMALILNQALPGRNGARAIIFSPVMLSGAAIGLIWIYIFDPRFGLLDIFISAVGLTSPNWLLDTRWSMPAIILVHAWKNVGFAVVIYLAGLQAIPAELYEAAVVDGADARHRFRHITLPGLRPVVFFLLLTTSLTAFQAFDIIKVMTSGGPVNSTTTLIYYLYQQGFVGFNAGRAGVTAVVLFFVMLFFTLVQFRLENRSQEA
jgi:multiple sugar transport system permease protein/sn-glycerol 3-phosphate transport system permease protein